MAIQKKHGKGRLDKWYKLAKEKGKNASELPPTTSSLKTYYRVQSSCSLQVDTIEQEIWFSREE